MRFRRKSAPSAEGAPLAGDPASGEGEPAADGTPGAVPEAAAGPRDAGDLAPGQLDALIDLGSLLVPQREGLQLRMQVDDATQEVQAVLLSGLDGALELMAFAAPRGDDELWDEVRPQLAADMSRRGGTAEETEGPWGTELTCRLHLKRDDGSNAVQPSRIMGISGKRWMLRATLLGRPALEAEAAGPWEEALAEVAVRRGDEPRGVGEKLPIVLPPQARPLEDS